jgi:site-specific DNA-cytosine methylase
MKSFFQMYTMKSLDLFSGIGGFTLALKDVGVTPVMYCECDAAAQRVLRDAMARGDLPKAPIHSDVRTLQVSRHVDMITAGFPCQGFSTSGNRQGLRHDGSSLISHVLRLVKSTSPTVVFLENVPALISEEHQRDFKSIVADFSKTGYNGRYVVMHGYDVQCPQKRKRVYLLFYKRGARMPAIRRTRTRRYSWATEPVPRMVLDSKGTTPRYTLLGNAVIPELTTLAFLTLWSGMTRDAATLYRASRIEFVDDAKIPRSKKPHKTAGLISNGTIIPVPKPQAFSYTPPTICLDPAAFTSSKPSKATSPVITRPLATVGWNTIRTGLAINLVLTVRSSRDIGTQIRFARDTPDRLRRGRPNPAFYEFLMGYPIGWTRRGGTP